MTLKSRRLVDSHVHLQDPVFTPDFSEVIDRACRSGVRLMICNSTSERDWEAVARVAAQVRGVVPCFGIHPWYLRDRTDGWSASLERTLESTPSAIGEAGLDRWYHDRDETEQERVFCEQLRLAHKHHRVIMVHCLKAWGWLLDVLKREGAPTAGMVLHAYGGPPELIEPLAAMGAYFSFAGNVLDERKSRMRKSLLAAPPDRLLLETDSPDLPPPDEFRVTLNPTTERYRNEPANLSLVLPAVAALRGEDAGDLAARVWDNAVRLMARIPGLDLSGLGSGEESPDA